MQIKNILSFLAGAALITCSSVSMSAQASQDSFDNTSVAFKHIQQDPVQFRQFRTLSVDGHTVRLIPGVLAKESDRKIQEEAAGANYAVNGFYHNERACMVFVDNIDHQGTTIVHRDSADLVDNLFDSRVFQYYVMSHEMSHCANHMDDRSLSLLLETQALPEFTGYGPVFKIFDKATREVYSDLAASLLGASKTGDWSVFTHAVLPLRTNDMSPTHSTTNAVITMLNSLDPKELKGASYEQVMTITNLVYRKTFMNEQGQMDPTSVGATKIYQDWYAFGRELQVRLDKLAGEKLPDEALAQINSTLSTLNGFSGKFISQERLHDGQSTAFLFALKQASLSQQIKNIDTLMPKDTESKQDALLLKKQRQFEYDSMSMVMKLSEPGLSGRHQDFDKMAGSLGAWVGSHSSATASVALDEAIPMVLADALAPIGDSKVDQRLRLVEKTMQTYFADSMQITNPRKEGLMLQASNPRSITSMLTQQDSPSFDR